MAAPLHATTRWPTLHTTQGLPSTRAPTTAHQPEPAQDSHAASDSALRSPLDQQSPSQANSPASPTALASAADSDPRQQQHLARQPRAPNPAKKVTGKDDIREAITRQAVADEQRAAGKLQSQHQLTRSNASSPVLAAAPQISPPTSPTVMSTSKAATRPDRGPIMAHRTASIDSTVSSISSASQRTANPTNAYRVSDNAGPQDAAALITAAGSAEAALQKLIAERQQAASHNAQLWRLVEKQRAMILGLNKDLEKALKEKERYRRKLKENLASSTSAPSLITSVVGDGPDSQEASPSPSHMEPPSDLSRDISVDTRKTSNSSEAAPASGGRSDTPQDAATQSSGLPATPQSANSLSGTNTATAVPISMSDAKPAMVMAMSQRTPTNNNTPPMSPKTVDTQSPKFGHGHSKSMSASSVHASPPASAQYYSSPKTRKAPPAPLKLDAPKVDPSVVNNIVDASDSEYEDDPESARSEFIERGRRKTREDDDREREVLARQEDEQRSRSKKEKKSKSRPSGDKIEVPAPVPQMVEQIAQEPAREAPRQPPPMFQSTANPAEIVRSRAVSDASGMLQRNNTAPSLMSPGLPMSPRPGDRPPNSPMPRQMTAAANSIPMSPKAGLPLSPRAPRSAIPLPPQTPLAMISPHLDRAKAYHQQMQPQPQPVSTVVDRLKPSPDATPDRERASTSSDPIARSPGEIFRGLTTEQYPDLLLPPNALPSIYVKTSSSRMRPSRASFIAPKHADENPVLQLAVHSRSDNMQLWRVEKTYAALAALDQQVKSLVTVRDRLPDKALFTGHAPAKIDARRLALNHYFDRMLDSVTNDRPAMMVCKFLSSDAIGGEGDDYFGANLDGRPESPASSLRPNRAGYLTKRGKNFGGWKARYFVLDGPNLKYFEGPGGAHLGLIKLQNAQIGKQSSQAQSASEDEENQFRHAFLILEPKKKDSSSLVRHVLCAESDEERDAWVDALLQYVDYRDDEDHQPARQAQVSKTEISAPRSPRMQKSMSDLRPSSNTSKDSAQSRSIDQVRTVNYNETVAGEAPIMGPPASPRVAHTPSPPYDKVTADPQPSASHPAISGPTNLQVIQNAGDWGMKPPPTPGAKDKKRSMFSSLPFSRGRSSSDLNTSESSKTSSSAQDSSFAVRRVFGRPLAEAVESANPGDATTELPAVVYRCIEYLMAKNAIGEEGIFRLSGSNTVIKSLKDRFDREGDVNLLADENHYDIHAVASLLKLYLRELPASILTRDLHIDFLKCLEIEDTDRKVLKLNALVHKMPLANRALLDALSHFMVCIVDNVAYNKMTVRNLGVVFSPTLNLPGPLISLFVEEQPRIFGEPLDVAEAPLSPREGKSAAPPTDLRSPRKQMFSDLPTPAYNQTQFQSVGNYHAEDTGMIPMHPSYASYQMAPQGDGGYGSLNDALRSPTVYGMTGTGAPTPRDVKAKRRESGMLVVNNVMGPTKKSSASKLREEQPTSF